MLQRRSPRVIDWVGQSTPGQRDPLPREPKGAPSSTDPSAPLQGTRLLREDGLPRQPSHYALSTVVSESSCADLQQQEPGGLGCAPGNVDGLLGSWKVSKGSLASFHWWSPRVCYGFGVPDVGTLGALGCPGVPGPVSRRVMTSALLCVQGEPGEPGLPGEVGMRVSVPFSFVHPSAVSSR